MIPARALPVLCLLLVLAMPFPARAEDKDLDRVRRVLRDHPELVLEALKGHEEALYDMMQAGLEKKRLAELRRRRLAQLDNPLEPAPAPDRAVRGPADAPVAVVAFMDFQFPATASTWPVAKQAMDSLPGRVRYQVRHQIMGFNKHSRLAAAMFEAAGLQDPEKAFALHDLMLSNRKEIEAGGEEAVLKLAARAGLDTARLKRDAKDKAVLARVDADKREARRLGITASPVYLVNGVALSGTFTPEDMEEIMELSREKSR